jgi:hypothetical protein
MLSKNLFTLDMVAKFFMHSFPISVNAYPGWAVNRRLFFADPLLLPLGAVSGKISEN